MKSSLYLVFKVVVAIIVIWGVTAICVHLMKTRDSQYKSLAITNTTPNSVKSGWEISAEHIKQEGWHEGWNAAIQHRNSIKGEICHPAYDLGYKQGLRSGFNCVFEEITKDVRCGIRCLGPVQEFEKVRERCMNNDEVEP